MNFPRFLFLLSFSCMLGTAHANDITNLTNGLVGYWPFCGNAIDKSGNGRNGTVNGAQLTKDRFGRDNSAYAFAGNVSSNITIGNITGITGDYTISFWEYTDSYQLACEIGFGINTANTTDPNKGYGIQMNGNTSLCSVAPQVRLVTDGASACTNIISTTQQVQLNKWTHIIVSRQGNVVRIFINGVQVTSGTNLSLVGITNLVFGMRSDATIPFKGILDDIALWNRALTIQEMQQLYVAVPTVTWSTGATTNKITVNPGQTTKYYVTLSDGITTSKDSVTVTVASLDTAVTALDPTNVCPGTQVRLQANASSGYQYQWLLNGSTIQAATSRTYVATQPGQYRVVLRSTANCRDTSRAIAVTVLQTGCQLPNQQKQEIYLPDAFTPNGDGINDILVPRLSGMASLISFKVYNRWGQLMYETDKKDSGWDGTFRGVKQPMEAYQWMAEGIGNDGTRIKKVGSTLLIR
ncbi:MAG: LamG-like jellyroll fold domain-containing protein [Bacteroidota bacterium]